ncbi:MAG: hypothetical protein AAFY59_13300, partial [Pseudomonadota bacterium]
IGTHKTGTTALQAHLAMNRPMLAARGVFYPRPLRAPGVLGASHRELRDAALGIAGDFDVLLERYARLMARRRLSILSCESWSSFEPSLAAGLAPLAEAFDVRVVVFLRRADHFLESMYRQHIGAQSRKMGEFPDYIRGKAAAVVDRRAEMLGWWADAFGDVVVIPYRPAAPGFDVFRLFFEAAGIPRFGVPLWPKALFRGNASLSREQAELVRRLNRQGHRLSHTQVGHIVGMMGRGRTTYLGEESRAALLARGEADMAEIARRFLPEGPGDVLGAAPERYRAEAEDWDYDLPRPLVRKVRARIGLPLGKT